MELFRSQPNLCSLFLSLLEEVGAETLDWSLLRDEIFVDRFLRRLMVSQEIDETSIFKASASLLQPSLGGMLVAPLLVRGGHFDVGEMESFAQFAVMGVARAWDPASWPEILTILEEVVFHSELDDRSHFLASMLARGWVPPALHDRFLKRVWETNALHLEEKNLFFAWTRGVHTFSDIAAYGPPPGLAGLKTSRPLGMSTGRGFASRRGFSDKAMENAV